MAEIIGKSRISDSCERVIYNNMLNSVHILIILKTWHKYSHFSSEFTTFAARIYSLFTEKNIL